MSHSRTLALAALGALVFLRAAAAHALENEFHGAFRVRGTVDNFSDGRPGELVPTASSPTRSFVEHRARLMYIAKANDDLKLVTHFELDSRWGDNAYNSNNTGRNNGGAIGADQTNLETKNVYLDFTIPSTPLNVKLGLQGFNDGYKGIIFGNDAAGLVIRAATGFGSVGGAYLRFDDATGGVTVDDPLAANGSSPSPPNEVPGSLTRDLINLNARITVTRDIKAGADWYLLYNDIFGTRQDRTAIHMAGVNAEAKIGPVTIDGFFLYQFGKLGTPLVTGTSQTVNAFAGQVGAKMKAGPGTLRAHALYISGDASPAGDERSDFQTIMERGAASTGHSFYASEMMILLRNKFNMNADRDLVFNLNNSAQGFIGGFLGYDLAFDRFFVNSNIGMGAVAKNRGPALSTATTFNNASGSDDYLGTEINTEIGYRLYDNLTTSLQAAYLFLGDYYTNSRGEHPEDPCMTRIQLNFAF
jgi:hypothetical protein